MLDAWATSPWTLPSHISLMIGEPTMVHLVENDLQRLPPWEPMLAEILQRAGWRTAGTFSGPYLDPLWGFDRGFDRGFERYRAAYGRVVDRLSRKVAQLTAGVDAARAAGERRHADRFNWKRREVYRRVRDEAHNDVSSDLVTRGALADLDELAPGAAPWFVFAHYFDPHYDYVPPAPWDTRFDPAYRGDVDGRAFFTNPRIAVPDPEDPDRRQRRLGDRDLAHVRAL
jgi:arylsulfatase A-like enzyme